MALHDHTAELAKPAQIVAEADELKKAAASMLSVAEMLRRVTTKGVWDSGAGCTFAGQVGQTPDDLITIANRLERAERIIRPYAADVARSKKQLKIYRERYDSYDKTANSKEEKLRSLTPEDPEYAEVDSDYRTAGNNREWTKRHHTAEGKQADEDEQALRRKLNALHQEDVDVNGDKVADPRGYNLFEGSSRVGTDPIVDNTVVDYVPFAPARAAKFLRFGDSIGKLGRRAGYGEGSYRDAGGSVIFAGLDIVGRTKGKSPTSKAKGRDRKWAQQRERNGAAGRYSSSSGNPIATNGLRGSAKNFAGKSRARTRTWTKQQASNTFREHTGIRLMDDMVTDWEAVAGAGTVKKGAHVVRYTTASAQKATSSVGKARAAGQGVGAATNPSKNQRENTARERAEKTKRANTRKMTEKEPGVDDLVTTPIPPPQK